MDVHEAKIRVEEAVNRMLQMPAGFAELGLAMFTVDRADARWVGRREALTLFETRLDELDAETRAASAEKSAWARLAMVAMVRSIESASRGEYRVRDARA